MLPQAKKQPSLLYVANDGPSDVTVYTYVNGSGLLLVGTLTGFKQPAGMCSDAAGHVWIDDYGSRKIFEYAHGGTDRIFTISEFSGFPYDCAVDPATGNIAVANQHPNGKYQAFGNVVVYPKGSKIGTTYTTGTGFSNVFFLTYDDHSNLYLDATPCLRSYCYYGGGPPGLYVLAAGSGSFAPLTFSGGTLRQPAAISWVNPIFLVGDSNFENQKTSGAYKIFVSGSTATVVGTIEYAGTQRFYGSWRRSSHVVVPDYQGGVVRIYNLSDGSLVDHFADRGLPFGAVVSQSVK